MKDQFIEKIFEHQALIHKVCKMYRDNIEDRQDLFQEIMYQLWKSYPSFKGKSKLSTWIYRISLNTAMASFRKKRINHDEDIQDHITDLTEDVTEETNEELLFSAIRKLDHFDKAIIGLYLEGMNYSEMAEIMGNNENVIGVRLTRIKAKLKRILNL